MANLSQETINNLMNLGVVRDPRTLTTSEQLQELLPRWLNGGFITSDQANNLSTQAGLQTGWGKNNSTGEWLLGGQVPNVAPQGLSNTEANALSPTQQSAIGYIPNANPDYGKGAPTYGTPEYDATVLAAQKAEAAKNLANSQYSLGTDQNPWPAGTVNPQISSQLGALNTGTTSTTNNGVGNSTSGNQFLPGQIGASFGNISQQTPQEQQRVAIKTDPNNITGYQDMSKLTV